MLRLTLRRLWVSEADMNTLISSKRSRSSSARSSPRSLGMSTERLTSSGMSTAWSTSAASASWGMTSGRTKLVSSSRRTPVRASASISLTLVSVGMTSGSFWKPSRGPTSRIRASQRQPLGRRSRLGAHAPSARAMTICWTSSVPSPMVRILASR